MLESAVTLSAANLRDPTVMKSCRVVESVSISIDFSL